MYQTHAVARNFSLGDPMSIITLDISEPFFTTRVLENEDSYTVNTKTIVLNVSENPIKIEKQE